MPKPVYIICANDFSEDKTSNLVSIFTIVESVQLTVPAKGVVDSISKSVVGHSQPQTPIEHSLHKTMAVWMKEPGDDCEFEHEFLVEYDDVTLNAAATRFRFSETAFLYRFRFGLHGFPTPKANGFIKIKSRVRRVGSEEWLSQEFPIYTIVIEETEDEAEK